jgi:DNA invertase Pin-like site-specific DNA recombinase
MVAKSNNTETLHIYTRVSTVAQEKGGTSLTEQREKGIETAQKLGFKYKLWNEGGKSSAKDDLSNRPVLDELLRQIDKGLIKHIYVWNTDRLSRNQSTWGMIRTNLVRNQVHLHTPTGEQVLSDHITNLVVGILGEVAQYENRLRTARSRFGKLRRVRENQWMGGPPPYGYALKEHKLVVDPNESKWVEQIFEWYRQGYSTPKIREELLGNGVLTKRGKTLWSLASIQGILTNTHYVGRYSYRDKEEDVEIECTCPRIMSDSRWNRIQNLLEKRSYSKGGTRTTTVKTHNYLLTGLLWCGHCGSPLYGHKRTNNTQKSYYTCSRKDSHTRDGKPKCDAHRNVDMEVTDQKIWNLVLGVLEESSIFKESVKREVFSVERPISDAAEKKKLNKRISELKSYLETIEHALIQRQTEMLLLDSAGKKDLTFKKITEELRKRRTQTQMELEEITTRMQGDEQTRQWVNWVGKFKSKMTKLNTLSIDDRKEFLKGVVDRVVVKSVDVQNHHIQIDFRLPYVGDKTVYQNKTVKRGPYKVISGKKSLETTENILKKVYNKRG